MKIALLHLDLSAGPAEKNIEQLLDGIKIAAANGAQWVITPEMAVQGYFFTQMNSPVNLKMKIENIILLSKRVMIGMEQMFLLSLG